MKHYDATQWADFVRGLTPGATLQAQSAHLQQGCPRCQRTVDWLTHMAAWGGVHSLPQVPTEVVHLAAAIPAMDRGKKALPIHRHFYCQGKQQEVDVTFRLEAISKLFQDVERCSYFGKGPVFCTKSCLSYISVTGS